MASTEQTPDWFFQQSAVIPYRFQENRLEVLLITTRKGRWIIPKGVVDPGNTPLESAANEAWEEAGVEGAISGEIFGHYAYEKWGGTCEVDVYLMQVQTVHASWPEQDFRDREWLSPDAAADRVREPELQAMLRGLPEQIEV